LPKRPSGKNVDVEKLGKRLFHYGLDWSGQ
jgi:hypothetical protein